jgi:hypothetical protein
MAGCSWMLLVNTAKYGPVSNIAKIGFNWSVVKTGKTHIKKWSAIVGVNQVDARKRTFHAMCLSPLNEQVFSPHIGSFFVSHSLSFST